MKKVIDRKSYNTETAEEIAHWESPHNPGDFNASEETLYRTKNWAWFLWGEGGPMSKYAVSLGNNSTGGSSNIMPLTPDEAINWLEEHDFTDEIEEHFADQIEEA